MFLLSLKTGLREGEEAALTWDEISMSERKLTVWKATSEDGTAKTESSCRIVDFNEDVMELLAGWCRSRRPVREEADVAQPPTHLRAPVDRGRRQRLCALRATRS